MTGTYLDLTNMFREEPMKDLTTIRTELQQCGIGCRKEPFAGLREILNAGDSVKIKQAELPGRAGVARIRGDR